MLPTDVRDLKSSVQSTRLLDAKFPHYVRRLCDFRQMDFEATFDQMLNLLSVEPQKAYISFYYRKQTKNQWARDDPAFVVIEATFVAISSLAYAIALKPYSFWGYVWAVLYSVLVDWLLVGCIIASACSQFSNKNLRQNHPHSVAQEVEWLYAFDVHANSFFCSFILTYVLQYFLLPVLLGRSALSCLVSNSLYALSTVWYAYITYLGYRTLPFLDKTQVFLWYPIVGTVFLWLLSVTLLALGLQVNATHIVMTFHYG